MVVSRGTTREGLDRSRWRVEHPVKGCQIQGRYWANRKFDQKIQEESVESFLVFGLCFGREVLRFLKTQICTAVSHAATTFPAALIVSSKGVL